MTQIEVVCLWLKHFGTILDWKLELIFSKHLNSLDIEKQRHENQGEWKKYIMIDISRVINAWTTILWRIPWKTELQTEL